MSGEAELHGESAGELVHDGVGVVRKRDGQRHHCPAQTQVTPVKLSVVAKQERKKEKYLTAAMVKCDTFAQEPGVSVSQRSAGRRRHTEDS